jgi:excisionase family DNA binding protein
MKSKGLLNVKEISEVLGVKVATIYGWVSEGYVPHIKLGRLVRFNLDAVSEWVSQKEVKGRNSRLPRKDFLDNKYKN